MPILVHLNFRDNETMVYLMRSCAYIQYRTTVVLYSYVDDIILTHECKHISEAL